MHCDEQLTETHLSNKRSRSKRVTRALLGLAIDSLTLALTLLP